MSIASIYRVAERVQKIYYYDKIKLPHGYKINNIFRPLIISPFDLAISPTGEVMIVGLGNHRIYKLTSDSNITSFSDRGRTTLAFNSKGELFCDDFGKILKISPNGETKIFISGIFACHIAVSPADEVFIMESNSGIITKVSENGEKSVFAKNLLNPCDLEFSPLGELYVTQTGTGEISRVNGDGSITTIAKGFSVNDPVFIAFAPDGNLFAIDTMNFGLARVCIEDGAVSPLRFFSSVMPLGAFGDFIFDKNGDIILLGTSRNYIFKISLKKERINVIVPGQGNSYALAISQSGEIFMGDDNSYPISPGRIINITKDDTVSIFKEGFGFIDDMVFDSDGNLYVFSFVPRNAEGISEGSIYKISTTGKVIKIFTTFHPFSSIAINPITKDIVGFDTVMDRFIKIGPEGKISILPIEFKEDLLRAKVSFDKDGNLFTLVLFSKNFGAGPLKRRLFKVTLSNELLPFANLDTKSSSSTDDISVTPTGDIFVIASEPPAFKILKITPKGKAGIFADNLPCDTLSLTTDQWGNIFFASSAGVFKIFYEGTKR